MAIFIMINSMAIFIMINSMAIFIMINLFQEISESCFDHLHLRKASFHGGSSYRNRQANVCYDAQVREHCYEHAVRG